MPLFLASALKVSFQVSKLAPVLPHLAASAAQAPNKRTADPAITPIHLPRLMPVLRLSSNSMKSDIATKKLSCHRQDDGPDCSAPPGMASHSHAKAPRSCRDAVSDAYLPDRHCGRRPSEPRSRTGRLRPRRE